MIRQFISLIALGMILVGLPATAARADDKPKDNAKDDKAKADKPVDPAHKWDDLAAEIIARYDKKARGFLEKFQFKKVDANLAAAIEQLARDGTIGKAPKKKADKDNKDPAFVAGFASADTDGDGKVTLAEFSDYVHRAVDAADKQLQAAAQNNVPRPAPRRR